MVKFIEASVMRCRLIYFRKQKWPTWILPPGDCDEVGTRQLLLNSIDQWMNETYIHFIRTISFICVTIYTCLQQSVFFFFRSAFFLLVRDFWTTTHLFISVRVVFSSLTVTVHAKITFFFFFLFFSFFFLVFILLNIFLFSFWFISCTTHLFVKKLQFSVTVAQRLWLLK